MNSLDKVVKLFFKIITILIIWFILLVVIIVNSNGPGYTLWFIFISFIVLIFRKHIKSPLKSLKNINDNISNFSLGERTCQTCKKKIGFFWGLFHTFCKKCYKINKNNSLEIKRIEGIINEGIETLKTLREGGKFDNQAKNMFPDSFDKVIRSLYNSIFSTVIATLDQSFKISFEMQKITKKDLEDFENFIKTWKLKAENDNLLLTKEDYLDFKDDLKSLRKRNLKDLFNIVNRIEKEFNINGFIDKIDKFVKEINEEDIEEKIEKIKKLERTRNIREEAERRLYGNLNRQKRISLTKEQKEMVFDKFNNKCAICNAEEGLHIHHKDQNPKNNQIDNLLVLCGICHKKVHMKVR